jgi:hypothetical protein
MTENACFPVQSRHPDPAAGTLPCKFKDLSEFRMLWGVVAFTAEQNVGFLRQSRHSLILSPCLLMTQSGHEDGGTASRQVLPELLIVQWINRSIQGNKLSGCPKPQPSSSLP